jgi:hypothetical protein
MYASECLRVGYELRICIGTETILWAYRNPTGECEYERLLLTQVTNTVCRLDTLQRINKLDSRRGEEKRWIFTLLTSYAHDVNRPLVISVPGTTR